MKKNDPTIEKSQQTALTAREWLAARTYGAEIQGEVEQYVQAEDALELADRADRAEARVEQVEKRSREFADTLVAQNARVRELETSQWLPIQTAPQDGTWIILSDGQNVEAGYWGARYFDTDYTWMKYNHRADYIEVSLIPTIWMPLPSAPFPPIEKNE